MEIQDGRTHRAVVNVSIKRGWHGPDPTGENAGKFLIDVVAVGVELAHVGAVDDVEVAVFAGADRELPGLTVGIFLVDRRPEPRSTSPPFSEDWLYIRSNCDRESALGGEVKEGVAVVTVAPELMRLVSKLASRRKMLPVPSAMPRCRSHPRFRCDNYEEHRARAW